MTPLYTVVDLGTLGGVTHAWDITNPKGQPHMQPIPGLIVGESGGQAVLWKQYSLPAISLGGAMARAINDLDVIVGSRSINAVPNGQAVTWSAQLQMTDLLVPAPGDGGLLNNALDINTNSQVVGQGYRNGTYFAFFYDQATNTFTNLFPDASTTNSFANAVNKQGHVVGGQADATGGHPFLWLGPGTTPVSIAPSPYPAGEATDINDSGLVVGYFYNTGPSDAGPFSYSTDTGIIPIGPSADSIAYAVNAPGEIVGGHDFTAVQTGDNFAWIHNRKILAGYGKGGLTGTWEDLNDLIDKNSGWSLNEATGINDHGQIVGSGTYQGQQHAFVLLPTGAANFPIALDINALARVFILFGIINDMGGFGYTPGGRGVRVPPYQPVDPLGPWREMLSARDRRRIVTSLLRGAASLVDDVATKRELLAMLPRSAKRPETP